jgi:gamma-glutamylcyclotransferase (GGCT)/AIG2-like uncharacterized protein YtfP
MSNVKIFVYGTLKEGGHFAKSFDEVREKSKPATIQGQLFDVASWFPGVKLTGSPEDIVYGELHEYKNGDEVLSRMNRIEGFNPDNPEKSLFIRKTVTVTTEDGEKERAEVYEFNFEKESERASMAERVENGVWEIEKGE